MPTQLFLLILSLKIYQPIKAEVRTIPMLNNGKISELSILGLANTLRKKNNEKKFGIPNIMPHITPHILPHITQYPPYYTLYYSSYYTVYHKLYPISYPLLCTPVLRGIRGCAS